MMKPLQVGAAAAACLLAPLPATAQKFSDVAQQLDAMDRTLATQQTRATPLRVQVTYQLQWPLAHAGSVDDQKAAISSVHAALYDLAAHECEQLKAMAAGECRLASLTIGNAANPQASAAGTFQASATATFEVVPPPATVPTPKP